MLSERLGQKESHTDLSDKVYHNKFEDKSGEEFCSISTSNGDIQSMRIHAGIVIDAQSIHIGKINYNVHTLVYHILF